MADEFDRKYLPDVFQQTFVLSLGAAYKGVEMMKSPQDTVTKVFGEMLEVAGLWMTKSMDLMAVCRSAGEKFTEAK